MRNVAKKVIVALMILAALVVAALAAPSVRTRREVADVSTASPTRPIATTAPILLEVPTLAPTVIPTLVPTVIVEVATPTPLPAATPTTAPTATAEPTPEPTATPEATPVPLDLEPASAETEVAAAESAPVASPVPTLAATPSPTATVVVEPTATPTTQPTAEPTATATATATPTVDQVAAVSDPTPSPTPTVDPGQARTAANDTTPEDQGSRTAVSAGWMYVNSDNGLYLRSEPGGAILSVLTHRSQVHATGRAVIVGERTWMEVDIPASAWVALEYITATKPAAPVVVASSGSGEPPTADDWAKLRNCESSGNYNIVDASGLYHGAYQFLPSTWDGLASRFRPDLVGVLPSQASNADQDSMAQQLYALEGARPWPVCGRFLL